MLHSNDNFKFWIIEVLPCIVAKIVCNPINSVDMIPLLPIGTKMVCIFFTSHSEKDILSWFSLLFFWKLLMTNIVLIELLVTIMSSLAIIFVRPLSWVFGFLFLLFPHDLHLVAYFIDYPLFLYITWNSYIFSVVISHWKEVIALWSFPCCQPWSKIWVILMSTMISLGFNIRALLCWGNFFQFLFW